MLKGFLVMLVMVFMVLFAMPAFACTECGRDGPASFSHLVQNDTILGSIGLVHSAPAAKEATSTCTLAIVGYDTGDPTEAVLAKVNEKETCIRSDKGAAQINLNGGGVTFAYVG